MNKVFSINNAEIINGKDMKTGDFGIVRERNDNCCIAGGSHVIKTSSDNLVCMENGIESSKPDLYEIEIKDNLKLQRIK